MNFVVVGVALSDGVGSGGGEGIVVGDVRCQAADTVRRDGLVNLREELCSSWREPLVFEIVDERRSPYD